MKFIVFLFCIDLLSARPILQQKESFSQASQDEFVYLLLYELLDKQDEGFYLEIGAGFPEYINNTFFFEKNFGWKGVSIDSGDIYRILWAYQRRNPLRVEDALQSDYRAILRSFPHVIDYLSLDIDDDYDLALARIPFDSYLFKVITIEHDFYRYGKQFRKNERKILKSFGYYLLCPDVILQEYIFEDWWIHPAAFPADVFSSLISLDLKEKDHSQIIQAIRALKK